MEYEWDEQKNLLNIKKHGLQSLMIKDNIDYSDIPETDGDFWAQADIRIPPKKSMITLRLDPSIVEYFKKTGRGYQTKINAILRSYVDSQ